MPLLVNQLLLSIWGILYKKLNEENLEKFNVNQQTLQQDLKTVGITSISDVFYAEMQKDGSIYVAEKNSEIGMMTQPKRTSG